MLWILQLLSVLSASLLEVVAADYTYSYENVGFSESTVPKNLMPRTALSNGDQFGYAVAIWHGVALVSASKLVAMTDGTVDTGGVVYMFYLNWETREWYDSGKQFITPYGLDGYGASIAIWDTTIAVGAPLLGNVHVYSGSAFQTETELSAHDPEENDYFGHSVAVVHGSGHYSSSGAVVVGAYGHSQNREHQHTGSVFVFALDENSEWKQVALIQPSRVQQNGYFGYSVSAYGNTIAVGAPGSEAVYVYSLVGTLRECPHEGHRPEGCEDEHHHRHRQLRRGLQGHEGEGDREREEHEREQHNPQYYTEWEYKEELEVVGPEGEELGFGTTVSVYNKTDQTTGDTVLSVAIGAVYDYESSSSSSSGPGAVYIISQMQAADVISSWHPTDFFPEHEHHRALQGGHENEKHNDQRYWPIKQAGYTSDKLDKYWMLESTIYGTTPGEKFGHAIVIEYESVVIGNHPEALGVGRVEIHSRVTDNSDAYVNIPLHQGPLYKTTWALSATLSDMFGNTNDMFGGAVSSYEQTVMVGSFLTGFDSSSNTIGTGAAYIYDSVQVTSTLVVEEEGQSDVVSAADPVVDTGLTGLMKSLTVVSFSFIVAVFSSICGFLAYKYTQRKISEGAFDSFYSAIGRVRVVDGRRVGDKSLSDMDSSMNSEHAMLGNNSERSTTSSQSSLSSSSGGRMSSSSYGSYSRPPPGGGGAGGYQPRQSPSQRPGPPGQHQNQNPTPHPGAGRQMGGGGRGIGGRPSAGPGATAGPGSAGRARSAYASRPGSSGGGMTSGMSNISGL